jgi:hypothetical protein
MAKFTGSMITQATESGFSTHLVPLHSETALCGAAISVKGLRLSLTSPELGRLLFTLLWLEASACQGCLSEAKLLD